MASDGNDFSKIAARLKQHGHRRATNVVEVEIFNPGLLAGLLPLEREIALSKREPRLGGEYERRALWQAVQSLFKCSGAFDVDQSSLELSASLPSMQRGASPVSSPGWRRP